MTHDELEQRLWELEYGLLTEEDGAALREQISADPEAAQSYGRIRAQLALLSQASRIEESRIELKNPNDESAERTKADALTSNSQSARPTATYSWIRRAANWTIGVAASLLLGVLSWSAWDRSGPADRQFALDRQIATKSEPVMIRVDTPQALSRESKNPITVWTSTPDGSPQSADLRFAVEDAKGTEYFYKDVRTDQWGRATIELPRVADDLAKLNVAAVVDAQSAWQLELPAAQIEYATHISTDKPRYRPGDVVRYRSVTLSRFGLKADREVEVNYSITDPAGQAVAGSNLSGRTDRGVGNGEFVLAPGSESGRYTLIARSPENLFPEARRDFTVQKSTVREYEMDVRWDKPVFEAGEQAQGKLAVRTLLGEPANDVAVNFRAYIDGRKIELQPAETTTDVSGQTQFNFVLPPQIGSSKGDFGVQLGQQDVVWKDIPLQADQVFVDFYPEGGDLVAGVESRVYFYCHDFDGRAVAIQGEVVDAAGQVLAQAATEHEGRGSFRLTPQPGTSYSLVIKDPGSITARPVLPAVVADSRLVLDAGPGVFSDESPIRLQLRSRTAPSDFSIVATCRGVTVGQLSGTRDDFQNGVCDVTLPVIDEAAGVLRVTVFDYSKQTPEPLAERLVYRRPVRKLNLQFAGFKATYAPGETVTGEVLAKDEMGQPISTVLGLSAIDEMVWQLADPSPPRLNTHFYLFSELTKTDKLEDVNDYLAEDPASAAALDLVLGTQGWRRFERVSAMGMAGRNLGVQEGLVLRRSGGLDGADVGEARRSKAELDIAGKSDDNLTESPTPGMLGGFGTDRLVEATEEAPRRYRNRIEVESLERRGRSAEADSDTIRFSALQPAPYLPWLIAVCLGLALVLVSAIVVRQHPTKRTLLATAEILGAVAILSAVIWPVYWLASQQGNAVARSGAEATQADSPTPNQKARSQTAAMRARNPASGAAEEYYALPPAAAPAESSGVRPAPTDEAIPSVDFGAPTGKAPEAAAAANDPAGSATADKPIAEKRTADEMTRKNTTGRMLERKVPEEKSNRDVEAAPVLPSESETLEKQDAKKGSPVAPLKQKAVPLPSAEPSNTPPPPAPAMRTATPPVPSPASARPPTALAPASPAIPEPESEPVPAKESPPKPAAAASRAISQAERAVPGQGVSPKTESSAGAAAAGGLGGVSKTEPAAKKEIPADQGELSKEFDARQSRMDRKADEVQKRMLMELKYSELQEQQQADDKRMRQAAESTKAELGKAVLNKAGKSAQGQRGSAGIPAVPEVADAESSPSVPALKANAGTDSFVIRRFANARVKDDRRNESDFDFTESVLWNPLIVTDEGGRASFQFDLPDTVTGFRVMADGHAAGRLQSADQLLKSTREN